jgi:hypothetical protein
MLGPRLYSSSCFSSSYRFRLVVSCPSRLPAVLEFVVLPDMDLTSSPARQNDWLGVICKRGGQRSSRPGKQGFFLPLGLKSAPEILTHCGSFVDYESLFISRTNFFGKGFMLLGK